MEYWFYFRCSEFSRVSVSVAVQNDVQFPTSICGIMRCNAKITSEISLPSVNGASKFGQLYYHMSGYASIWAITFNA